MKKSIQLLSVALLIVLAPLAQAWTVREDGRQISYIGAHSGNWGYLALAGGINANCSWQGLYFDIASPQGKAMLATLIAAKTSGKSVLIGYTPPPSSGMCTLELAAISG